MKRIIAIISALAVVSSLAACAPTSTMTPEEQMSYYNAKEQERIEAERKAREEAEHQAMLEAERKAAEKAAAQAADPQLDHSAQRHRSGGRSAACHQPAPLALASHHRHRPALLCAPGRDCLPGRRAVL